MVIQKRHEAALATRVKLVCFAAKADRHLDPVLKRRVDHAVARLREPPCHQGVIHLQSDAEIDRVIIGDLRILFSVEDQLLLVLIGTISHRGSIDRSWSPSLLRSQNIPIQPPFGGKSSIQWLG